MVEFRRSLAASFLFRFFVHVAAQLEADVQGFQPLFPDNYKSAALPFHRPPVQGLQYWSKVPGEAIVGQPTRHMAADLQVSTALRCIHACLCKQTQLSLWLLVLFASAGVHHCLQATCCKINLLGLQRVEPNLA